MRLSKLTRDSSVKQQLSESGKTGSGAEGRSYKDLGAKKAGRERQPESGCRGKGPSQNLDCVWEIALGRPKQASINEWP